MVTIQNGSVMTIWVSLPNNSFQNFTHNSSLRAQCLFQHGLTDWYHHENAPKCPQYSKTFMLPYCLLPLCFANFRLLVSLGQDVFQSSTLHRPLIFDRAPCALLRRLLHRTLLVLTTVKNSPCDFTWVATHEESSLTFLVQEIKHLWRQRLGFRGLSHYKTFVQKIINLYIQRF